MRSPPRYGGSRTLSPALWRSARARAAPGSGIERTPAPRGRSPFRWRTIRPGHRLHAGRAGIGEARSGTARAVGGPICKILHDPLGRRRYRGARGALTGGAGLATGDGAGNPRRCGGLRPVALRAALADRPERATRTGAVHRDAARRADGRRRRRRTSRRSPVLGDVMLLYDNADALRSPRFPRLREALALPEVEIGVGTVMLTPVRLGDGNEISIPRGWQVTAQGAGSVVLRGPQGEFMSLGATLPVYAGDATAGSALLRGPCCDPTTASPTLYPPDREYRADVDMGLEPQEPKDIIEAQLAEAGVAANGLSSSAMCGSEATTRPIWHLPRP